MPWDVFAHLPKKHTMNPTIRTTIAKLCFSRPRERLLSNEASSSIGGRHLTRSSSTRRVNRVFHPRAITRGLMGTQKGRMTFAVRTKGR
jgi:hypothetical protein